MMEYVKLWRDNGGWRAVVVYNVGNKLAHAVEPTTGDLFHFPKDQLRLSRPIPKPRWRKLAKQLKRTRKNAAAYGWRIADKQLKEIGQQMMEVK